MSYWGIDLGGTKIEVARVPADLNVEAAKRHEIKTEASEGYDHIISRIALALHEAEVKFGEAAPGVVGIGTPGAVDPSTGLHKNSNTTAINGRPFIADLSRHLGRDLVAANDANCFALAEATLGAGKGLPVVFGIIMGTGVGGGIVVNGQVLTGCHAIAGEWGHNVADPDGEPCYCGRRGCVETILSGPALERHYRRLSGTERGLTEIVQRHRSSMDYHATETIDRLTEWFGRCLGPVVNVLDPDAFVIGGGVGNIDEIYAAAHESLAPHVFNPVVRTQVLKPILGANAGSLGAAMLISSRRH